MPIFFNKNSLTDEQSFNFERALQEYQLVQVNNAKLQKDTLDQEEKLTNELAQQIDILAQYHQPDEKSALFHRLLSGKKPLPYPPPTSFSYPWYAVVEDDGPFEVFFGGYDSQPTGDSILINQCLWQCVHRNESARELIEWYMQHTNARSEVINPLGSVSFTDEDQEKQQEFFALCKKEPEFIVKFDHWGPYKLHIGRKVISGRRRTIFQPRIDLDVVSDNIKVVQVLEEGANVFSKQNKFKGNLSLLMSGGYSEEPVTPESLAQWDWIEAQIDGWILTKIVE